MKTTVKVRSERCGLNRGKTVFSLEMTIRHKFDLSDEDKKEIARLVSYFQIKK